MAIAIASDPASEGQLRQVRRSGAEGGLPGMLEALVEQLDDVGKNVAQIVEDALHFAFNLGTLRANFASAPQAFERGFQAAAKNGGFDLCKAAVVALD